MYNLFPGANPSSVLLVWDYCKARKLDPLKKPCHIVPMQVKDARTGEYSWRDVVMPGIYEYRTTANRTGEYMGHSRPEYGPAYEYLGVTAPEWCALTVYRWNARSQSKCEYPVQVFFREVAATVRDKKSGKPALNSRWTHAPIQMMTKCAEAAGLREAFPDELGGEPTAEESEGRVIEDAIVVSPRSDSESMAHVDPSIVERIKGEMLDLMDLDEDEDTIALKAFDYATDLAKTLGNLRTETLEAVHESLGSKSRKAWTAFEARGRKIANDPAFVGRSA